MSAARDRLAAARLYLVCGEQPSSFLHAALTGGVEIVQLRMKDAPDEEILRVALRVAAACREHGALFVLNDRPDLVAAAGADGVHVGQDDAAPARARSLAGAGAIVGRSTHSPEQVDAACADPDVDYLGVGPVHATPTKPGRPAVGLSLVAYAAANATKPFFAIGGIDPALAPAVVAAGANRIAVVRALTLAEDPARAARALRRALEVPVGSA